MANYDSDVYTNGDSPRGFMTGGVQSQTAYVAVDADLDDADLMRFFKLPKNAIIIDMILTSTDIDTGATPAAAINVGTPDDETAYFSAADVGQGGGIARMDEYTGHGSKLSADTLIQGQLETDAAAAAAGVVALTALFTMQSQDEVSYS